jgi:hypothetical protein
MIDRLSRDHVEIVNMEAYNAKNSVGFGKIAYLNKDIRGGNNI